MKDLIKKHLKKLFEETFNMHVNNIIFYNNRLGSFFGTVLYDGNKELKYRFITNTESEDSFTTKLIIPPNDNLYRSAYFANLMAKHDVYKRVRSCYNLNHKYKQYRFDEYDSPIVVHQIVKGNQVSITHDFSLHIFSIDGIDKKSVTENQLDTNLILDWKDDGLIKVRDTYLKQSIYSPNRRRILAFQGHGDKEMEPNEDTYNFILDVMHQNFIHFITDHQCGVLPIDDLTIEEVYQKNHAELNYRFIADNLVRDMSLI